MTTKNIFAILKMAHFRVLSKILLERMFHKQSNTNKNKLRLKSPSQSFFVKNYSLTF